jgi:transposase
MPAPPLYRSQILDHLGLVAAMFDELGIGDVIDQATQQNPEMRDLTVGEAVKAMVLNGLGFVNQALYLVPMFFQNKPTYQLVSPRVAPEQLNDDALGRALDTLYAYGVTELYSLIAATAAKRLALCPTYAHLDTTSFHVDGRYNHDDPPAEHVVHITKGYSRDHRPDLHQVMLELIVEHQAGIPTTYLVADSALYSADNLEKLQDTHAKWITRVPATLHEAHVALSQAEPATMSALKTGYRYQTLRSTYGDVAQRWLLIYSEPRRLQVQRTVTKRWLKHSEQETKAFKKLCRSAFACQADARLALSTFEQGLKYTTLHEVTIRPTPRYDKPGRPKQGDVPPDMSYHIEGTLASPLAAHEALVVQESCFILATNELNEALLPPLEVFEGYQGQQHAERGFRFLKSPEFLASSLYLKKAERIMALLMVMTVCLLVYAALEYRIRQALKDHGATFPNQNGQRVQNPTARWVFHYFVGLHLLSVSGQWPLVLNLTEEHCNLLKLLGKPYMQLYGVKYS